MPLRKGTKAPAFSLPDQDGNRVSLSDFTGKKLAIFFYPKDNTPTCTEQACNLRDNITGLKKAGIHVIGVSMDSGKRHKNFEQKYSLPFPLLADVEGSMIKTYKVWGQKMLFGREYMGILRTTYLVNEEGKIAHVIEKVTAKDHARQILDLWN
ncbi:MAG TPA: thioredoxin-dependent thiol peroxidase [Flavipsychrobacter sp.]|nr:thioredoxin-dependent thiol peroxidase [Flavipsychrobacter sp.]